MSGNYYCNYYNYKNYNYYYYYYQYNLQTWIVVDFQEVSSSHGEVGI